MRHLFSLVLLLVCLNVNAQNVIYTQASISTTPIPQGNPPGCITDVLLHQKQLSDPAFHQHMQGMNYSIQNFINNSNAHPTVQSTLVVPVVVHIIHNNGPENISNAQVLQGIQDMNDAFANTGPYANANGVNTGIQFCLALQDENGNASTGINRVVSALTNETAETDDIALKNLIRWDPTKYLNIWLVNEITSQAMGSGVAGYAYFPSSHGNPEDGIVNEARWFGSDVHSSKVHIHEAGHYLGLYHTFNTGCLNNNCQLDGDMVCDTPPDNSSAAASCASAPNSCSTDDDDLSTNNPFRPTAQGGLGDQSDMIENYMDYGFQNCQLFFSAGQGNRMTAALSTTRASLLQSIACNSLCVNPITIGFNMSASVILTGGTVNCTNTTTPTSTYSWELNGVPMGSSTNYSQLLSTPGTYTISLLATNGDISCDERLDQIVTVNCQAQASFTMSPAGPYNPGATINFTNTSSGATNYEWVMDGVSQGTATNFNFTFNNAGGHSVYLIANNGQCYDTSTVAFFKIGNCDLSHMIDHWFMAGTSLDFSSGSPVVGASPVTGAGQECTSAISDINGNLLFYTNGMSVWNRNNIIMSNGSGLMGHQSASQGSLITPDPGNPNRYYIFTTGATENNFIDGFRYSVVDMTLNSGLGDVTAIKNVFIFQNGEKVTATWHSNRTDIWIATHSATGTTYYAYLLTAAGLNTTPILSSLGASCDFGLASMKFSHDGQHVATNIVTYNPPRYIDYADFNSTTGVFSNAINLSLSPALWEQPNDVEFSPDNSKLYASVWNYGQVYQWDLSAGSSTAINATKTIVDTYPGNLSFGRITLAPNGVIYVQGGTWESIDAITNPNLAGTACNYVAGAITMLPGSYAWCIPNFMSGIMNSKEPSISGPASICTGQIAYTYSLTNTSPTGTATWWHSGTGTVQSTTDSTAVLISGTNAGADTLIVTYYGTCGVSRDTLVIQTTAAPSISLGNDTALCGTMLLMPGIGFSSYLWQNSSTANSFTATTTGTYWVQVTNANGCTDRDTIIITANPNLPAVNLGSNITVCLGHTAVLNAGNNYTTYAWQDGWAGQTYTAYQPGTYWVTVTGPCYTGTDTIQVIGDESGIVLDLGSDTVVCASGFPFTVNATVGYPSYLWDDNSTASTYSVTGVGQVYVTVTDANGCSARDTLNVSLCTSIGDNQNLNAISIYPNPANQFITINYPGNVNAEILLYNSSGQLVFTKKMNAASVEIAIDGFAEGLYMIEVQSEGKVVHKKLLILHN